MLQTLHNNEFPRTMDLFEEIDDLSDLFFPETHDKLESTGKGFEDLQSKYSSLHETYAKEIENSKKVEKCLVKCLKFYSKLCKKYEVQQKIIRDLEENIKEKVSKLEEAQRNEEEMRGLIEVYRTERALYAGQSTMQLRKEKEILLDICCKLMGESLRNSTIRNLSNLLLKKFRKDLDIEKIIMLKEKSIKMKDKMEFEDDFKPKINTLKEEVEFKFEEKYNSELAKAEMDDHKVDKMNDKLDLSKPETAVEETESLNNKNSDECAEETSLPRTERDESEDFSSLPTLEAPPIEPSSRTDDERQPDVAVHHRDNCDSLEGEDKQPQPNSDPNSANPKACDFLIFEKFKKTALEGDSGGPLLVKGSTSIFDISDVCPTVKDSLPENKNPEKVPEELESLDVVFGSENREKAASFVDKKVELNLTDSYDDSIFPYDKELAKIFAEMTSIRVLSPIREINSGLNKRRSDENSNPGTGVKRNSNVEETGSKSKKLKSEEESPKCCLLDSIMSAMSIQNEEFKSKRFERKSVEGSDDGKTEGSSRDSIMSAMSIQNEEFKSKRFERKSVEGSDGGRAEGSSRDSIVSAMSIQNEEFKSKRFERKSVEGSDGGKTEGSSRDSIVSAMSIQNEEIKSKRFERKSVEGSDGGKTEGSSRDSIMSAMSIQNEEFKSKRFERKSVEGSDGGKTEGSSRESTSPETKRRAVAWRKKKESPKSDENSSVVGHPTRSRSFLVAAEKLVREEIRSFVSSQMLCKEDADKNVKHCISVLKDKPDDIIVRCIVGTVLENVDEELEMLERPAPPLTKTQHRLIVLLSVFRALKWDSEEIYQKILSLISEKLFPDNFFWPDDCVEAATRFYAALCRSRNDLKKLWGFCLVSMTEMRQRCPLLVFTVLKTWPDVLHDASTLKSNILGTTMMTIFLHMPMSEGLRNSNQKRKLLGLKHLLINFYHFKVEDTMEGYAKKVLNAVCKEEYGAEKALVLLAKCRDSNWTMKNVMPSLKANLIDWVEGNVKDSVANAMLSVIRKICPTLLKEESIGEKVKDLGLCLSGILTSGKKNHESEVNLVKVLLLLKQYPAVRKVIQEWRPKSPINDSLRNEIINASADNILRELRLNRREPNKASPKKKKWKKSKAKKKRGAKAKRTDRNGE